MNFEIIEICPRTDIYGGLPANQDNTPTVADYTPPFAKRHDVQPNDSAEISLSSISKAWAHSTDFYTGM